jgi:hypothetical protein
VPMSPNTTPSAATVSAAVRLRGAGAALAVLLVICLSPIPND